MKELRDKNIIASLLVEIKRKASFLPSPPRIMEVCGTHTMTIHKYGLKQKLNEAGVEMVSGPGCPVCITPNQYHETALELVSQKENFILATFGDMTRVPTSRGSLQTAVPALGSKVQIVYSPQKALELAKTYPHKQVVFFGVGFETTIPGITLTLQQAQTENLNNYSILSAFWLIPPPLKALVETPEINIDGFLYPGHVSAIIGEKPYQFLAQEYNLPGAIAGFEPTDILIAVSSVLDQIKKHRPIVDNCYTRVVKPCGNIRAQKIMKDFLIPYDANWRGLGQIPQSGLKIRKEYANFEAKIKHGLDIAGQNHDLPGCRCGEVLQGKISPLQCSLFANQCDPRSPHGPCMVSVEGACFTYYKYKNNSS